MDNPFFRFLRKLFRIIRAFLLGVGLLVTLSLIFVWMRFPHSVSTKDYSSSDKLVLHWQLKGEIVDKAPDRKLLPFLTHFWAEDVLYLPEIAGILKHAKEDPQITGIFIELGNLSGDFALFSELRNLLTDFQSAGKEIVLWSPELDNKSYYLASLASKLYLAPEGQVIVPGPMIELVFFGDALKRLGVNFEVLQAGKYKSALEPFILNQPSPDARKMYSSLEESLRRQMIDEIAVARKVDEKTVSRWLKHSFFTGNEAIDQKLVDSTLYLSTLLESMDEGRELVDFADWAQDHAQNKQAEEKEGIALIEAVGEMYMSPLSEDGYLNPDTLREEFEWALEEEDIKAVVLRVDSPGGSTLAADLIWEDVRRLAAKKPLVVSMGSYAASGGYYISAPAAKILALPGTITGSIGVIAFLPRLSKFQEKYGVNFHTITASERGNLFNPAADLTSQDRKLLRDHVDASYRTFVQKVSDGRKKIFAEVDDMAQGRVWTGQQAKDLGLVDELGGLTEAVREAKTLAGLDVNKNYPLIRYTTPMRSLRECLRQGKLVPCLLRRLGTEELTSTGRLSAMLSKILKAVESRDLLSRLPLTVNVK